MRPTPNFDVTMHTGRAVVAVAGDVDIETCPSVTEPTAGIDLRGLVLVPELRGVPDQPSRVLEPTGTRDLFALHPPSASP